MGLDMYLEKHTYVKNWDHMKPEERTTVTISGARGKEIKPDCIREVVEEVMYWRKANHIHAWFGRNCTDGNWDERRAYVTSDHLRKLLAECEEVLAKSELVPGKIHNGTTYDKDNPKGKMNFEDGLIIKDTSTADRLLPTQSGFFYGSTEYNEWYLSDVKKTAEKIKELLAEDPHADYEYVASW